MEDDSLNVMKGIKSNPINPSPAVKNIFRALHQLEYSTINHVRLFGPRRYIGPSFSESQSEYVLFTLC